MGRRLGAQVPVELQNVALKWGIVGAILMRGVMILVGVELIERFRHIVLLFAGILLAISYLGGEAVQVEFNISDKSAQVFQGILLFLILACDTLIHYRIRFVSRKVKQA